MDRDFSSARYLSRLHAGEHESEQHFTAYLAQALTFLDKLSSAQLRRHGVSGKRLDEIQQETMFRVLKALYERRIHSPEKLRSLVEAVCKRVEWEYEHDALGSSHEDYLRPYPFDEDYLFQLKRRDRKTEAHFIEYFRALLTAKLRSDGYRNVALVDIQQETLYRVLKAVYETRIQNPRSLRSFVYGVCERVEWEYDRDEWRHWAQNKPNLPERLDESSILLPYYGQAVDLMFQISSLLSPILGSEVQVRAWLNAPHPDLGDRTPTSLIMTGHGDAVLTILENALAGVPT